MGTKSLLCLRSKARQLRQILGVAAQREGVREDAPVQAAQRQSVRDDSPIEISQLESIPASPVNLWECLNISQIPIRQY